MDTVRPTHESLVDRLRNSVSRNRRQAGSVALVLAAGGLPACSSEAATPQPVTITSESLPTVEPTPAAERRVHDVSEFQVGAIVPLELFEITTESYSGIDCDPSDIPELPDGIVVVDGRCDQQPEAPVGIYRIPEQASGEAVGTAPNGAVLESVCYTLGGEEDLQNADGQSETIDGANRWVKVITNDTVQMTGTQESEAYIPSVWVEGGESLPECEPVV